MINLSFILIKVFRIFNLLRGIKRFKEIKNIRLLM